KKPSCTRHAACAYWEMCLLGSSARAGRGKSHKHARHNHTCRSMTGFRVCPMHWPSRPLSSTSGSIPYPLSRSLTPVIVLARDPFPDVRRTVVKCNPVPFPFAQEPNSLSIHQDDILEIQYNSPTRRFSLKHCGQFADVVRLESTAQGQDDIAI